jgi:hypothetical protein
LRSASSSFLISSVMASTLRSSAPRSELLIATRAARTTARPCYAAIGGAAADDANGRAGNGCPAHDDPRNDAAADRAGDGAEPAEALGPRRGYARPRVHDNNCRGEEQAQRAPLV